MSTETHLAVRNPDSDSDSGHRIYLSTVPNGSRTLVLLGFIACLLFPFNAAAPDGVWQILAILVATATSVSAQECVWRLSAPLSKL